MRGVLPPAAEGTGRAPAGLRRLALASALAMLVVVAAGALVTNTGSGHGCGNSWPLCNGRLLPVWSLPALIEFGHRLVTGLSGLLLVPLAVWTWRRGDGRARRLLLFGLAFVVVESFLGAAAVLWGEPTAVLALHFGISLLAFTGIWLVAAWLRQDGEAVRRRPQAPARFRRLAWTASVTVYGVIYLGAYVQHVGAAGACGGWPLCRGALLPPPGGLAAVEFVHRLAALVAVAVLALLAREGRRLRGSRPELAGASATALLFILLQALSGGLVVLGGMALGLELLHTTLVTLLFAALSYTLLMSAPAPEGRPAAGAGPWERSEERRLARA
ncbi:MAG: heme A synthase [Clostridia bacterium]|nr:heme A synthase [Clostridia bacterium]MCL6522049.1 COX15/CtaA family protein [Bacillota bacterium]